MKSNLMIRMMIFSFALVVGFMLGLSNAGAQGPCIKIDDCTCQDATSCTDPMIFGVEMRNCGDVMLDIEALIEIDTYVSSGFSVFGLAPGEVVYDPSAVLVVIWPGIYSYLWTVTATDDAGNVITDNCEGECSVPPCDIPVSVDIKPMSCPNPLNVKDRGVLSVAIVGTELDVIAIDPTSVRLEGVAPIRFSLEDVATPFDGEPGDCHDLGSDGYLDLVLKFDAQEIITALGDVSDGDVLVLSLTGNLMVEYGSTPILGEDVVVILKKGK